MFRAETREGHLFVGNVVTPNRKIAKNQPNTYLTVFNIFFAFK